MNTAEAQRRIRRMLDIDMRPFLHLRPLQLKDVTVIVSDNKQDLRAVDRAHLQWSAATEMAYAEELRAQLLDSSGQEISNGANQSKKGSDKCK